ncbi:hypothetical protein ACIQW9_12620 [Herminiimonas sp. NPDC097707]|uniref:hypothetical protein n=1 Tax=Herminiimonas sp. NPDC097707 TaxID=3364007 RepID=UPI00383AD6F3
MNSDFVDIVWRGQRARRDFSAMLPAKNRPGRKSTPTHIIPLKRTTACGYQRWPYEISL